MNEFGTSALVVLLLGMAVVILSSVAVRWWGRSGASNARPVVDVPGPPRQPSGVRILSKSGQRAGDTAARRPIRVLEVRSAAPQRIPQVRKRGSIPASAPVPEHALCTWCGRPVCEELEQRGGAVQCRNCGYFSHRRCFQKAGDCCGGACQL